MVKNLDLLDADELINNLYSKFKNDEEKENVSPIVFADSDKTPTMPFRKRILGESNLNSNRSPKNGLFEIKSRSPPKSQDSGNIFFSKKTLTRAENGSEQPIRSRSVPFSV